MNTQNKENFFEFDNRSIRFSQVLLGLVSLYFFWLFYCDRNFFFTENAFATLAEINEVFNVQSTFSIFNYLTTDLEVSLLIGFGALLSILIIIDRLTLISLIINFFLLLSFCKRFYSVFSPLDLALRTSYVWMIFFCHFQNEKKLFLPKLNFKKLLFFLFSIQLVIIYVFSFLEKIKNPSWSENFSAMTKILQIEIYTTALAKYVSLLPSEFLALLTIGSLVIEIICIWMIFIPKLKFRYAVILIFMLFHLSIQLLMNVGGFSVIALSWWVLYLPASFWEKFKFKNFSKPLKPRKYAYYFFPVLLFMGILMSTSFLEKTTKLKPHDFISNSLSILQLHQGWWMFSNIEALSENGWLIIEAELESGKLIDPLSNKPVNQTRKRLKEIAEQSIYLKKFLTKIVPVNDAHFFQIMKRYICHRKKQGKERISGYKIFYAKGINEKVFKRLFASETCPR